MMRGEIFKHWQISAATLFSVVIVVGAYFLARGIESPPVVQASTETALLQAIASKDFDADGLTDWQEELYGTDPHIADTFHLGMTDGEAVARGLIVPMAIANIQTASSSPVSYDGNGLPPPPADGTLTSAFVQNIYNFYLAARDANGGADLSDAQMSEVANESIQSLASIAVIEPDYKSEKDLTVINSDADALKVFAANAEAIFRKNTSTATTSEINYLQYAEQGDDTVAISQMNLIAKGYRDVAAGLSVLPVPKSLAADDLLLINAMMRVSQITSDFAKINTDLLSTIVALEQYPQAVQSLKDAFTHIRDIYKSAGITIPTGTHGASFVGFIDNLVAKQVAEAKKS